MGDFVGPEELRPHFNYEKEMGIPMESALPQMPYSVGTIAKPVRLFPSVEITIEGTNLLPLVHFFDMLGQAIATAVEATVDDEIYTINQLGQWRRLMKIWKWTGALNLGTGYEKSETLTEDEDTIVYNFVSYVDYWHELNDYSGLPTERLVEGRLLDWWNDKVGSASAQESLKTRRYGTMWGTRLTSPLVAAPAYMMIGRGTSRMSMYFMHTGSGRRWDMMLADEIEQKLLPNVRLFLPEQLDVYTQQLANLVRGYYTLLNIGVL